MKKKPFPGMSPIRMCLLSVASAILVINAGAFQTRLVAQSTLLLVQPSDLKYQGAFRLPSAASTAFPNGLDFGGAMLAFNPATNSLFMSGYNAGLAEVTIAPPAVSSTLSGLATASVLQPMVDPGEGIATRISATYGPTANSDILVYNGRLIGAVLTYYDAAYQQMLSHYTRPLNLSQTGQVQGLYQVGNFGAGNGGRVSGWMAAVPAGWQSALGGPVLVGQCCIPIITRTSWGPSAISFDPASLGSSPAPVTPLIYYPNDHPFGPLDATDPTWNGSTVIGGMVLPSGTRSLLYFGKHGLGPFCYGIGGSAPTNAALEQCYDLEISDKGMHGYPYVYQVTAYDANDMAAVKSGAKKPWDLRPYAVWQLKFPESVSRTAIGGVAYDPASGRIFVTQLGGDSARPLVHVFTIGGAGTSISYQAGPVSTPANVHIVR
jgi:hypothetical protein